MKLVADSVQPVEDSDSEGFLSEQESDIPDIDEDLRPSEERSAQLARDVSAVRTVKCL